MTLKSIKIYDVEGQNLDLAMSPTIDQQKYDEEQQILDDILKLDGIDDPPQQDGAEPEKSGGEEAEFPDTLEIRN